MRIWSLHPSYLDAKGLVAAWREGLLAQKVLVGGTRGYRNHPQLERFRKARDPLASIGRYLAALREEALARGYSFEAGKILAPSSRARRLPVTEGQVAYELELLRTKLEQRAPDRLEALPASMPCEISAAFALCPGGVESWEKIIPEVARKTGGANDILQGEADTA